jgi:long-chain acyl-CoA synthetase
MDEFGFEHFTTKNRDAVAVIDQRGRTWTRGELWDTAQNLARAFVARGLGRGDVVAIVAPNCAEYLATCLAGVQCGLYVVPVNWHLALSEIAYLLADSGALALVVHSRLGDVRLARLRELGARLRALVSIDDADGFEKLAAFAAPGARPPLPRMAGRLMPYTSATTGKPKAVRKPLETARDATRTMVAWHRSLGIELERDNVHLCTSMLYHMAPLEGALIALEMGHAVVLADSTDPAAVLSTIEACRVTTAFLVPTMFVRMLKLPSHVRERHSAESLRFVVHGGAACAAEIKRRMIDWWGPIIWEAYGSTEVQGTIASSAEWLRYPGTVGRPIPGSAVRILDDDGREVPIGQVGHVYLKPHTGERFEYAGDAAKTLACRRGDFVTVGDLGYVNEPGYLFLCGRASELIISSGMNIYPAEIEQALLTHPAVVDCAVVGVAHEVLGQVPHAYVQPNAGTASGPDLTRDLVRHLAERLAPMKMPHRFHYAATLPRDPNGKLARRDLASPRALQ